MTSFADDYILVQFPIPFAPFFGTPSGSLTSFILRDLASTNKRTHTWKITSKACKTSIGKQTILDGLVLLGDGLLTRVIIIMSI